MMRATVVVLLAFFAANESDAAALSCQYGASPDATMQPSACATSTRRFKDNHPYTPVPADECTMEDHQCLTGKWNKGWNTAYGCFKKDKITKVQNALIEACTADSDSCGKYNTGGVPTGGWAVCNTTDCNPCGVEEVSAGDVIAPSMLIGILASLAAFMLA
jgi:hypothetical protein